MIWRTRRRRPELRFEVIPLIDVMFTLLIFFVIFSSVLATYQNNRGMKMRLPSAATVTSEKKFVTLTIDEDGAFFLDKEPIEVDQIRTEIATQMQGNPQLQVMINADQDVAYERLVRALDEVRLGGCYDVVLQAERKAEDAKRR